MKSYSNTTAPMGNVPSPPTSDSSVIEGKIAEVIRHLQNLDTSLSLIKCKIYGDFPIGCLGGKTPEPEMVANGFLERMQMSLDEINQLLSSINNTVATIEKF